MKCPKSAQFTASALICVGGWGSTPNPARGSLLCSPDPQAIGLMLLLALAFETSDPSGASLLPPFVEFLNKPRHRNITSLPFSILMSN